VFNRSRVGTAYELRAIAFTRRVGPVDRLGSISWLSRQAESSIGHHQRDRAGNPAALQENPMASKCEVCGKGPSWGMSVSHSHRRTKRRWNPNIQRVRASVNGAAKRVNVCTGCIKSGKIVKAG
jgi:large subunit ribosomal protein L28